MDPEDPILTSKLLIARPFRMWTHIFKTITKKKEKVSLR